MSKNEEASFEPSPAKASAVNDNPQSHSAPVSVNLKIAVIDKVAFTRDCIALSVQNLGPRLSLSGNIEIKTFASCDDVSESETRFTTIVYHFRSLPGENLADLLKLSGTPAAVIVLSPDESVGTIRAAFEYGARGYIPTRETGLDPLIEVVSFVNAGGTFVPPGVLAATELSHKNPHGFTKRELLILGLLKAGKQNKVISRELGISESTVKVCIRNILSKLRANNRTEAVSAAIRLKSNWAQEDLSGEPSCPQQQLVHKKPARKRSAEKHEKAAVLAYDRRQSARMKNLAEIATTPALRARLLQEAAE